MIWCNMNYSLVLCVPELRLAELQNQSDKTCRVFIFSVYRVLYCCKHRDMICAILPFCLIWPQLQTRRPTVTYTKTVANHQVHCNPLNFMSPIHNVHSDHCACYREGILDLLSIILTKMHTSHLKFFGKHSSASCLSTNLDLFMVTISETNP